MNKKLKNPKIEFFLNSLLIDKKILVISDLHIGSEDNRGFSGLIQLNFHSLIKELKFIFKNLKNKKIIPEQVIILGDLKDYFSDITHTEWRETLKLIDFLLKNIKSNFKEKIILIKGNHDIFLKPIALKKFISVKDFYFYNNICFLHGHKYFQDCNPAKFLIMGHLHPAITLRDNYKSEKYKCFLKGRWLKKSIYILPSLNYFSIGYNLNPMKNLDKGRDGFLIINQKQLQNFDVIIYNSQDNKTYNFGKLKNL